MRTRLAILLVMDLATLHRRRSEKWAGHDDDVVASTIAEMDFELAPPVAEALHAAIDRHDLGYTPPSSPALAEALAGVAARRLRWSVDPEQVAVVPDVMAGLIELCRTLAQPVAFATPAYPPFFRELPQAGVDVHATPDPERLATDIAAVTSTPDRSGQRLLTSDPLVTALARLVRALHQRHPDGPPATAEQDLAIPGDMPNMPIVSDPDQDSAA